MITNNYQIYQQNNTARWRTILTDLALNRFRYKTELPLFNERYFEYRLLMNGRAGLFFDTDLSNYVSLGVTFNDYNLYDEPINFTAIGRNYSKNYNIGAWCIDNYSNYCLLDLISEYANDLANIDTTLYFLTKKLKQPYIFQIPANKKYQANVIMNELENNDFIKLDRNLSLEDISLLNLNVNNTSIEQLQDCKAKRFAEILEVIGVDTISYEKNERLTEFESTVNQDKINRFLSSSLKTRQDFCDRVKNIFGVSIEVNVNKYNNLLNTIKDDVYAMSINAEDDEEKEEVTTNV